MHAARLDSLDMADQVLTTATWGNERPSIVMLHDGLGSIGQWREVPAHLADLTGRTVVAYDRAGHGRSTPVPEGPWPPDWLHSEARVLGRLLAELDMERPILVGHSDGGSIALLHAAESEAALAAVVALAPHTWVEAVCVDAIATMRKSPAPIIAGLARHHADPVAVFEAWSGVWVSSGFRCWDVRDRLGAITAPTLVLQGSEDGYATAQQAIATAAAIGHNATSEILPGLGHLLHHDDPDTIVRSIGDFVAALGP